MAAVRLLHSTWSCRAAFCLLALLLVGVALQAASVHARSSHPRWRTMQASFSEPSLEYYVQVVVGTPYTGVLIPPLNSSVTNNFGDTENFAFNLTVGTDSSSKSVGFVRGYTVQVSYTSTSHEVEVEVVSYDDGFINGTISLQGLINTATNEIAVLGGTGDFRGVRGYTVISRINSNLFHHSVYFL